MMEKISERIKAIAAATGQSLYAMCDKAGISSAIFAIRKNVEPNPQYSNISAFLVANPQVSAEFLLRGEYPIIREPLAHVVDSTPYQVGDVADFPTQAAEQSDFTGTPISAMRQTIEAQKVTIETLQQLVQLQRAQLDSLSK